MNQNWSVTQVNLGKHGDTQNSRVGFVNDDGLVALPPVALKRFEPWAKKMGVSEIAKDTFMTAVRK